MIFRVFDVEILRTVEESGGWDATDKMGISCAAVYDNVSNSFRVFGDGDESRLVEYLTESDLVVGFNHIEFDWRVVLKVPKHIEIRSFPPLVSTPQFDVLQEIWKAAEVETPERRYAGGFKLDLVAQVNLGQKKRMSGQLAPIAWKNGKYCEVIDYCIHDVALTRDLFLLILDSGQLKDPRTGESLDLRDSRDRMRADVRKKERHQS